MTIGEVYFPEDGKSFRRFAVAILLEIFLKDLLDVFKYLFIDRFHSGMELYGFANGRKVPFCRSDSKITIFIKIKYK